MPMRLADIQPQMPQGAHVLRTYPSNTTPPRIVFLFVLQHAVIAPTTTTAVRKTIGPRVAVWADRLCGWWLGGVWPVVAGAGVHIGLWTGRLVAGGGGLAGLWSQGSGEGGRGSINPFLVLQLGKI